VNLLFTFSEITLKNKKNVRGIFLHSPNEDIVYVFSRNTFQNLGLDSDGYVASIPAKLIEHIEFFHPVYLYERISALKLLTDRQKDMLRKEVFTYLSRRGFKSLEPILNMLSVDELMVVLTEVENGVYAIKEDEVVRYSDEKAHPIDLSDDETISWLVGGYMEAVQKLHHDLQSEEVKLDEYRKLFYDTPLEEIKKMSNENE
jgi:hypothetical protein